MTANLELKLTFTDGGPEGWIIAGNPETDQLLKQIDGYDDGTGNFNSGVGNVTFSGLIELTSALASLLWLAGLATTGGK